MRKKGGLQTRGLNGVWGKRKKLQTVVEDVGDGNKECVRKYVVSMYGGRLVVSFRKHYDKSRITGASEITNIKRQSHIGDKEV